MKKFVILLIGLPGAGKSTYANVHFASKSKTIILSRDRQGGTLRDLLPVYTKHLKDNTTSLIVMDNTHLTREQRNIFIQPAYKLGIPVVGLLFDAPLAYCETRILLRTKSPLIAPFVLAKMANMFETPDISKEVGLVKVKNANIEPIVWDPKLYSQKALFLDVDGTLRDVSHLVRGYPIQPSEVRLIQPAKQMCAVLQRYTKRGFLLIAVSNQSGIARRIVSHEEVQKCFQKILDLMNHCVHMEFLHCPHFATKAGCYCRKPHTGMIVYAAQKWNIDPTKSIVVGDQTSDKLLAENINCKFIKAETFWK